jgi:copper(I)-binding protein
MRHVALAFAVLLGLTGAAAAQQSYMQASGAWARAMPGGSGPVAVYFTLHDGGDADNLTSVSADAAGMAMMHRTVEQGGVSEMLPEQSVPVPAGGTVTFRPGGLHVMLTGLNRALKPGDTFSMELTFDRAPPLTVPVVVRPITASGP